MAGETTPAELVVSTFGWSGMLPKEVDNGIKQVDIDVSCFGKVSPLTPLDSVRKGFLIQPSTFMPNKMDINDISKYLQQSIVSGSGA